MPDRTPSFRIFERERPPAGARSFALSLGSVEVELRGLPEAAADELLLRHGRYAAAAAESAAALRVPVRADDTEYFIRPSGRTETGRLRIEWDGRRVRYTSYRVAAWFDPADGRGDLLLGRGTYDTEARALENFLRAAVAWLAASRGGALVHAAGAVWRGRAFLFYGESGAGKSTLAACNRRARIVSDDLSLVLPAEGGGLELVGSPFRGTWDGGPPVVGRFPLVGGFRLIQAPAAEVRPVPRVRALAELVGNLPFVAEAFAARPDLFEKVQSAFAGVPLAHLHFRRDETYWDAIEAAGY